MNNSSLVHGFNNREYTVHNSNCTDIYLGQISLILECHNLPVLKREGREEEKSKDGMDTIYSQSCRAL